MPLSAITFTLEDHPRSVSVILFTSERSNTLISLSLESPPKRRGARSCELFSPLIDLARHPEVSIEKFRERFAIFAGMFSRARNTRVDHARAQPLEEEGNRIADARRTREQVEEEKGRRRRNKGLTLQGRDDQSNEEYAFSHMIIRSQRKL